MTLVITQRDDEQLDIVVRDQATLLPIDLTGCSLWFYVKVSHRDADIDAIIAKDPADVVIDSDQVANKGQATIQIAATDTEDLADRYLQKVLRYELQLKDSTDKISTVDKGTFLIEADIVRTTA